MRLLTIPALCLLPSLAMADVIEARFKALDTDNNGKIDKTELKRPVLFRLLDKNKDGIITLEEAKDYYNNRLVPNPMVKRYLNIPYTEINGINPNLLSLDIYTPTEGKKLPVLIMIHGGGWRTGDKANRGVVYPKSTFFTKNGFLFVSTNYRLSPAVQHPVHVKDVAKAVAFVHNRISKYGGDPERIFIMGHSAGAHLAALVATNDRFLKQEGKDLSIIKGVIPLDTAAYDLTKLLTTMATKRGQQIYETAFGKDPKGWKDASPVHHISKGKSIPPFLIYATNRAAAKQLSKEMTDGLKNASIDAEMVTVDKTHSQINQDIGKPNDKPSRKILTFLQTHSPSTQEK